MRRREFITLLGRAAVAWPLAARAQQPAMPVIGYFSARTVESDGPMVAAFRKGLQETGYVEGQNVAIEFRWGDGQYDRLPMLAEDLVRRHVAVIVTSGGERIALAAKAATTTIPIVFLGSDAPAESGLVASLARPGGNVTGVATLLSGLVGKQFGLLRELVPAAEVIAMLVNPNGLSANSQIDNVQAAASSVGQQLKVFRAGTEAEIDAAFAMFVQERVGALLLGTDPFFVTRIDQLVALAVRHAVPVMYPRREFAEHGGLISYGSNTAEAYRQLGLYAGKILAGAAPADLPVVQSAKFELLINLKTTKALGITVPPTLLAQVDEVIE
jgi:putative ABC transport system substrate-binding protein